MKALTNHSSVRLEQGFAVYTLNNDCVEISAVPELGAKIISLKDLRTDREWLWHPDGDLRLFQNRSGDDFSTSPLVGVDECLPTISPCEWRGRNLPDHGEVWTASWSVDHDAWEEGKLKTSAKLKISPFDFERTIELHENEVVLSYRLKNRGASEEQYLWAIHPLLRIGKGDRLVLPESTRAMLNGEAWIDALDSAVPDGKCSKLFAGPLNEGFTGIHNHETGECLEVKWSPAENNMLGLWLTRGGWHGHHHFAIEPTNADSDALTLAVERKRCGMIAASGTAMWQVRFRIGSRPD